MYIQVLTLCVAELFTPFWESINLHQFWPFVEIWVWEPSNIRHKCQMIRLCDRLEKMSDRRLSKKIFIWAISHCLPWAKELKYLFHLYDLLFIFQNRLFCDIQDVRSKCFSNIKKKWSVDKWYKPKLPTYCFIKNSSSVELYMQHN